MRGLEIGAIIMACAACVAKIKRNHERSVGCLFCSFINCRRSTDHHYCKFLTARLTDTGAFGDTISALAKGVPARCTCSFVAVVCTGRDLLGLEGAGGSENWLGLLLCCI